MEFLKTDSLDAAIITLFGDGVRIDGRRPVYGGDKIRSYNDAEGHYIMRRYWIYL